MQKDIKIVCDVASEFREMLRPWIVGEFWNVDKIRWRPGVIYIINHQQFVESKPKIVQAIETIDSTFVFSFPDEGSETLMDYCWQLGLRDLILSKKLLLIGGGVMPPEWPSLHYDKFLTMFNYFDENIDAAQQAQEIFTKLDKPYKFLFLNGREAPHRKYMIERLDYQGLLDQAIWSYLSPIPACNKYTTLLRDGVDLMQRPRAVKLLDPKYEIDRYRHNHVSDFNKCVKSEWFNNEWGDIYVNAQSYIDTYFSLVTETVFDVPYSFRTEKIAKPLGMGHPFIAVANQGYYRDLRNLGFRTFGNLIDENFDNIDNNADRIDRIATVVVDLCQQDLVSFLKASQEICKYNQQHLAELCLKIQQEFPERLLQFLQQHE